MPHLFLVLVALSLPGGAAVAPRSVGGARPNVLFLLADDQRADTVSALGNPHVVTPTLDALAARGFAFRNAYCMGSWHGAVCMPSRAMLLSGRDLFHVPQDLAGITTLPQVLAEAGYQTFATGKWHNGEASFVASFQSGARIFFGGMSDHTRVPLRDLPPGGELSEVVEGDGFSSELFADAAIEFLRNGRDPGRPFFLYAAFTAPHDPRQPPPEWRAYYAEHRPPLPANYLPLHPFHNGWMTGRDETLAPWPRTPEVIRDQLGEYYGMISHLDREVGRVLAVLEETGEAANTLVIYTADHGLALGSHGLLGKQNLYEHSTRPPLILAGPGVPHGSSDALVYLFDLFPTVCAFAGARLPEGLAGADLSPVVGGERPGVRDELFTSYEDKMRAVRDARWKLIRYPLLNKSQLFDLAEDPDEIHDLAGDPDQAPRLERLLADLRRWQAHYGDGQPLETDDPQPLEYDPSGWTREPDRWQPAWIREKYFGQ